MDVFMGYNEDTCASIVTNLMQDPNLFEDEVKLKHFIFTGNYFSGNWIVSSIIFLKFRVAMRSACSEERKRPTKNHLFLGSIFRSLRMGRRYCYASQLQTLRSERVTKKAGRYIFNSSNIHRSFNSLRMVFIASTLTKSSYRWRRSRDYWLRLKYPTSMWPTLRLNSSLWSSFKQSKLSEKLSSEFFSHLPCSIYLRHLIVSVYLEETILKEFRGFRISWNVK